VPLPWSGAAPPFGFGPPGSTPWLPQPAAWRSRTAEAQTGAEGSFLELYRAALLLRREHPGFRGNGMAWLPGPQAVLHFDRPGGLEVVVNVGHEPVELPMGGRHLLLTSGPLSGDGRLPGDTAAWLA
jgi:alpha-glucosidase